MSDVDRHRDLAHLAGVGRLAHREHAALAQQAHHARADLRVLDLLPVLPCGDDLQAGRPQRRHRVGEALVQDQVRLVDLQRHPAALLERQLLLALQRAVEHVQDELHHHAAVVGPERAHLAVDDQHLAVADDVVDRELERVAQHLVERLDEQPQELVARRVELGRRHARRRRAGRSAGRGRRTSRCRRSAGPRTAPRRPARGSRSRSGAASGTCPRATAGPGSTPARLAPIAACAAWRR